MRRNAALTLGAIVILITGILVYMTMRPDLAKAPVANVDSTPTGVVGAYDEEGEYFSLSTTYPTDTPLVQSASERADREAVSQMKRFVTDTIASFKKESDLENLTPEDAALGGYSLDNKYELQIHYVISSSASTVSYIFTIYTYTGGAHGNTYFQTFTFDSNTGALLKLSDLFVPDVTYLETLSSISREVLPKSLEENLINTDFITDGTTPEDGNFSNFFLDGTSLIILFPPYAVAPYVAGPQTVVVPTTELVSVLKPAYQ